MRNWLTTYSTQQEVSTVPVGRILSLDVMRGLIMILLAAESCNLYESLRSTQPAGIWNGIIEQMFHHPWHGLHFWDLVQPAFMMMAGSAMYISYSNKEKKGINWSANLPHILGRCLKLFICGTALHCVYSGRMVWELWNVLTQLSVTTLIAYLIIKWEIKWQIFLSILLLLLTETAYRNFAPAGFDQPFVQGKNFGSWTDIILMGKINTDGWVAINFLPTAAHTIWGVCAGKLLLSNQPVNKKIIILTALGILCLLIGYGMDVFNITPIIKRIATSSFAIASAGWVLLMLALVYWIADVKHWNKNAWIFTVVGMNPIFIYLFFETVGHQWLNKTVAIFINGFTSIIGMANNWQLVCSALATLFFEWYVCYWLYKRKIFFKL